MITLFDKLVCQINDLIGSDYLADQTGNIFI